jgi:hypothetical protein
VMGAMSKVLTCNSCFWSGIRASFASHFFANQHGVDFESPSALTMASHRHITFNCWWFLSKTSCETVHDDVLAA